jgi:large subunit GTPase 1
MAGFNLSLTPPKLTVGLVGYPNVGKSSTINALVGAKKVSVSSTPGKTKNFQTIHLSDTMVLCDCPGLVFPQFAGTNAEMICDGVLPIDQMREFTAPVDLVTRRIPQEVLEATYGLRIHRIPIEEGGSGIPTGRELLSTYAGALCPFLIRDTLTLSQLTVALCPSSRSGLHHSGPR